MSRRFLHTSPAVSQWEAAFSQLSPWCWKYANLCGGSPLNNLIWRCKTGTNSVWKSNVGWMRRAHEWCDRQVSRNFSLIQRGKNGNISPCTSCKHIVHTTDRFASKGNTHSRTHTEVDVTLITFFLIYTSVACSPPPLRVSVLRTFNRIASRRIACVCSDTRSLFLLPSLGHLTGVRSSISVVFISHHKQTKVESFALFINI